MISNIEIILFDIQSSCRDKIEVMKSHQNDAQINISSRLIIVKPQQSLLFQLLYLSGL